MTTNTTSETAKAGVEPSKPESLDPFAHAAEFTKFIETGTARLTPRLVAQLISEEPAIREKLPELDAAGLPQASLQLAFLLDVVEGFTFQRPTYATVPYQAALEAAFAVQYFHRDIDLVPDSLGAIGYVDDAAVAATVIARHSETFAKLAKVLRRDWSAISPGANQPSEIS
ncbi:MAG TPA: DUF1232 domain-containing protein, partial [Chthoniobacteraceae bacterium]|jgi:uncharacterized membrane protein YkvA (DUF1232 family)